MNNSTANPTINDPIGLSEPPSRQIIYNFIHTNTTTVHGRGDNYTMSERHLVIENGVRTEYAKETKYSNGEVSILSERGDPAVVSRVSVANDKFIIKS